MILNKGKIITSAIFLFFLFVAVAGFYWGSHNISPAEHKPALVPGINYAPKVTSETTLIKDKEYLCRDVEKIAEEGAPAELHGLDRYALLEKFPVSEGWMVSFTDPRFLTITQRVNEFCPIHRTYRHLGIFNGLVAVYEGPLGYDEKVFRVENIPLDSLNPDFRIKLEQAREFSKQSRSAAEELRLELEYSTDDDLNAALENLDENM